MSTTVYEDALRRHFRRSLHRGLCRNTGCTTCGAQPYVQSLRDEVLGAWAVAQSIAGTPVDPPSELPPSAVEAMFLALAALAERHELTALGVDQYDLWLMRECWIDRHQRGADLRAAEDALHRAEGHVSGTRPNREDLQDTWRTLPAAQRLRDLIDDTHPSIAPPWLRADELAPVLELGVEDLGRLATRLGTPRMRRGTRALREALDYARALKDPADRLRAVWRAPSRVPANLADAYRATLFVVSDGTREIVLRIGARSEEAAELHRRFGVLDSCIVTAWNPESRQLPTAENAARHRRLEGRLAWLDLPTLPAEGRDPGGQWTPEQSLWIAGPGLREALFLGRAFEQHAVVCIGPDAIPRLAWPAQARFLMHAERIGGSED